MKFVTHTLLCVLVLFLIFVIGTSLMSVIPSLHPDAVPSFFLQLVIIHIVFIVLYFCFSKKFSLFALPMGHIIFSLGYGFILLIKWLSLPSEGDENFVFLAVFSWGYFALTTIITLIASFFIHIHRRKIRRTEIRYLDESKNDAL